MSDTIRKNVTSHVYLFIIQVLFKTVPVFWYLVCFLSLNVAEKGLSIDDVFLFQHKLNKLKFKLDVEIYRRRNIRIEMFLNVVAESIEADFVSQGCS